MNEMKDLEKIVKESISLNKCKIGLREVKNNIKGSNLIILSNSISDLNMKYIESNAEQHNVKVFKFKGNSVKLGKLCRIPYKISCISLRGITDEIKGID